MSTKQKNEIIARDNDAVIYEKRSIKQKGYHYVWLQTTAVESSINVKQNDIVLDAGCGTSRITRSIAKKCKKIYAVDFSKKSIELLRNEADQQGIQNIAAMVGDLSEKIYLSEKVDKAISVQVIQHIPTNLEREKAVKNINSCLKPGGIFTMTAYNWNNNTKNKGLQKEGYFNNGIAYFRYTPEEIKSLFEMCGFNVLSIRGYINFGFYGIFGNNKLANLLFYPVTILDKLISRFELSCKTGNYLICVGIKKE